MYGLVSPVRESLCRSSLTATVFRIWPTAIKTVSTTRNATDRTGMKRRSFSRTIRCTTDTSCCGWTRLMMLRRWCSGNQISPVREPFASPVPTSPRFSRATPIKTASSISSTCSKFCEADRFAVANRRHGKPAIGMGRQGEDLLGRRKVMASSTIRMSLPLWQRIFGSRVLISMKDQRKRPESLHMREKLHTWTTTMTGCMRPRRLDLFRCCTIPNRVRCCWTRRGSC